jgi:hypothetical protein
MLVRCAATVLWVTFSSSATSLLDLPWARRVQRMPTSPSPSRQLRQQQQTRPKHLLRVNVPSLVTAYYAEVPNPSVPEQRVAFGTSGHRGSQGLRISTRSMRRASTEQIICAASWRKHR